MPTKSRKDFLPPLDLSQQEFVCMHVCRLWQTIHLILCCLHFVYTLVDMNEKENEKKGWTDRICGKKPEVVKGNESVPVSLQPLWRIIAAVFFSGWEMPKRDAQTKHLPQLLFYYNISSLTIPRLSLSQASPAKGPPKKKKKKNSVSRKKERKGRHLGDKREKWWHYDVPVMLIKVRERVHSAMFHRYQTITFCVQRDPVRGFHWG